MCTFKNICEMTKVVKQVFNVYFLIKYTKTLINCTVLPIVNNFFFKSMLRIIISLITSKNISMD